MVASNIKSLLLHLDELLTNVLHSAVGYCVEETHYEITTEHLLIKLLDEEGSDLVAILRYFDIPIEGLRRSLVLDLQDLSAGNSGKPLFSPLLLELLQDAWIKSSIDRGEQEIRSSSLLLALLRRKSYYGQGHYIEQLKAVNVETLESKFVDILRETQEQLHATVDSPTPSSQTPDTASGFLDKYCIDITQQAREGEIDPVFGRDKEIRQMIDILARRRKNNPICVGEPGVGKTAVIEGLALRIIEDDIPEVLHNVKLLTLDLGLLEAGASVKGEFEKRLKGVIEEVKASEIPIILFIDEAHTLIGAGASAGGDDAANLLKPALARGELRTIAATTWSEYKKYFEKDPAMARRFQLVSLDEPDVKTSILILRGLKESYENAHKVMITDDAIETMVTLSDKYITGRFLPDKAIDLLDTSCARVKINLSTKPPQIEDKERLLQALQREAKALQRDLDNDITVESDKMSANAQAIEETKEEIDKLSEAFEIQKAKANDILQMRETIAKESNEHSDDIETKEQLPKLLEEFEELKREFNFIDIDVNPDIVAKVVSGWTGIPLGKMLRDESQIILELEERLAQSVKGQAKAHQAISEMIRLAKSGIKNPDQPSGVFLLVGPSGVGKTETALTLAEQLFGSRKHIVTVNMSEFQESHTVSRLIGSPPGYVGYGEGGMLTEAVRKKPYSVVLLDEVEKAHLDVMELFYQMFDKGTLTDGEGKEINFKNTIIVMTSNLASDIIEKLSLAESDISLDRLQEQIRPTLTQHFKPALLGRMTVVPFVSLNDEAMRAITILKLDKLKLRLLDNNKMHLSYTAEVVTQIVNRCTDVESGARNIESIINAKLLPILSREILAGMIEESLPSQVDIDIDAEGAFTIAFPTIERGGADE